MKYLIKSFVVLILLALGLVGCSENSFSLKNSRSCEEANNNHGNGACTIPETPDSDTIPETPDSDTIPETPDSEGPSEFYSYELTTGSVDILFIVDNSNSMYTEQEKMADKFAGFMGSIENLNYQIAITTTDVSSLDNRPRPVNQNGDLQDGKFISFGNGRNYLSSEQDNDETIEREFIKTIRRPETLACSEQNNWENCPSWDERAIAALNRAFRNANNESSFYRKNTHLAIVILSDEDERSQGAENDDIDAIKVLENEDRPGPLLEQLKKNFAAKEGEGKKVISVHSIVTDTRSCEIKQNSQGRSVRGFIGRRYMELSRPSEELLRTGQIINGTVGSICDDNYSQNLKNIAQSLKGIDFIELPCEPIEDTLNIIFTKDGSSVNYRINKTKVTFDPQIPAGVKIKPSFKCKR